MIGWLQSLDVSLFRFINSSLSNPFFDKLMPFVSDSPWFACILIAISIWLMCGGGARGRICVLMLVAALCIGNWLIVDTLKHAVGRVRPFHVLDGVHLRIGMGDSFSMPSSHSANWFSAALILFVYFRRSIWAMLPLAVLVAFSRIYNGVHYPSDTLAGAALGVSYSLGVIFGFDWLWQQIGPRWFPVWHARLPSLARPIFNDVKSTDETEWLRLGYVLIAVSLFLGLAYIGSGKIELSEDEAYQWIWSKHPALSYYSKPPLIAYAQFVGTHLWGDNEFGVRFFSPVIAAILSLMVLRFMTREAGARLAVIVIAAMTVTPLLALGSIVMTVDPLSVLFWTAAMFAGWRAAKPEGTTGQWLWVGIWMGLGFLSKYTNLAQCVCWCVFFALWPPARKHLRKPGPYLALLVTALSMVPVLLWNAQHGWVTVRHVASDGQLGEAWHRTYVLDFLEMETGLLHPFFFLGALWAAAAFWRRGRNDPLSLFFFSMGAPLFLGYFILSWHSRVLGNWIAPSVIPLFCLAAVYWWKRWAEGVRVLKRLLVAGLILGAEVVLVLHEPNLVAKVLHRKLPAKLDLLRRASGWKELAQIAGNACDGKSTFIICEHYGFTSEITFYLPEAKRRVQSNPFVFYKATKRADNQFYFWPNYLDRKGENALFVRQVDPPALRPDWLRRWWNHDENLLVLDTPKAEPPPAEIQRQFESFTDLGFRNIVANGNIVRRVQLIECHHLR
ncbi:MAG TPA: glycosyltransferase family 39 protein [Verrucomicrobiae bacterium]|nr:glycosyltransferase family 39 protein [Verrucomicrobiae bacterium]